MPRHFNTAGPCQADIHYTLPTERRLPGVRALVDQRAYFVLHAPRQAGKTTALLSLARALTAEGRYAAVLLSVEVGAPFAEAAEAIPAMVRSLRQQAEHWLPGELWPPDTTTDAPGAAIQGLLGAWAAACPRPLVVFIDEVDALQGKPLLSILRQVRAGYPSRPGGFPHSVALCGMRDVRDYRADDGRLGTASPFNIKVESFTLANFSRDDVAELYGQHTAETGQSFTPEATALAFHLSDGQPWLVNALARQCVEVIVPGGQQAVEVTHVRAAAERLVQRMDTHLDSLAERLREPRVRAIVAPILLGTAFPNTPPDDLDYAVDLGIVKRGAGGGLVLANPIYAQVIPRVLATPVRMSLDGIRPHWLTPAGELDPARLLSSFTAFWRQHGRMLMGSAPYAEVAAQLVMMAWLDRVANGEGWIDREYAVLRGRIDLCLHYRGQRFAFELKAWRPGQGDPAPDGVEQLDGYLDGLGLPTGWLVVFDQRGEPVEPSVRTATAASGRRVTVVVV